MGNLIFAEQNASLELGLIISLFTIGIYIIIGLIFGYIAHVLGQNRGFTRTQFWWGFFLNILGLCMVALMPTYRIYDEEERKNYIDPKKRELDHYAPAFRNHSNGSANKPKTNKIDENVKYEKINDNKYWGNDIDSIVDNKKDLE